MSQAAPTIEEIFHAALEIDGPQDRSAFLDRHCNDPELLRRVERLLALDAQTNSFLEAPALMPTLNAAGLPLVVEPPGTPIGPYTLIEPIGEGGMGTVYLADQTDPVRRQVALKVIKPGMDSRQVIARFAAERQALALMDHPNIAKVHDAGTTAAGRPYFVMELVPGLPINEYCDRKKLPIRERLELFILVCRALQHAHQKGIIHRDLKPSNVLVAEFDGVGVPKVIDFGVAKALGDPLTDHTYHTEIHQFVGTPLYMSPEQAVPGALDVDSRGDIYSLGVLLYELLCGTTPLEKSTLSQAPFHELQRILREQFPTRPSLRLSTLGDSQATVAANRVTDIRRLERTLNGELDWITMKTLEKDRNRRYDTANDLAADLLRHLTGQPVVARPPSAIYHFRKFASRNRAALITTALVAFTLVLATALSLWQAVRATRAEAIAAASAEETGLVLEYLVNDVFGAAAPERLQGKSPSLQDMLKIGEAAIPARFGRRPAAEATARIALGRAYVDLGRYIEARPQFRRAAALRAEQFGPEHPKTLEAEALLIWAFCPPYGDMGPPPEEVEQLARHVLDSSRRVFGPSHPRTLLAMTTLAHVLRADYVTSMRLREIKSAWLFFPTPEVARKWSEGWSEGRLEEAQVLLRSALVSQTRQLGPDHHATLQTSHILGSVLGAAGYWEESERALRRAAEGRLRVLGPDHPATLSSLKNLAYRLRTQGDFQEALLLLTQVVDGHRRTYGLAHPMSTSPVVGLLGTYRVMNDAIGMRDVCQSLLLELLEIPTDPDPFQRARLGSRLANVSLNLVTLPAPVVYDSDLAIRAARKASELASGPKELTILSIVLDRTGHHEEAIEKISAVREHPTWQNNPAFYWITLALFQLRAGDFDAALDSFEIAHQDDHENWIWEFKFLRDELAAMFHEAGLPVPEPPDLSDEP